MIGQRGGCRVSVVVSRGQLFGSVLCGCDWLTGTRGPVDQQPKEQSVTLPDLLEDGCCRPDGSCGASVSASVGVREPPSV